MREQFTVRNFSTRNMDLIIVSNRILDEYRIQGYRLSLRQLYYQLVARNYIENSQKSYSNIGNLLANARQAGYIDWSAIEDRTRTSIIPPHWNDLTTFLSSCVEYFALNLWSDQSNHVEVMVEKDALSGVIEPICRDLRVYLTANKGYCSSSTLYEIGKRIELHNRYGKDVTVLYFGDHDPSGMDMYRDIQERLLLFSRVRNIEFKRVALNLEQVEKWQLLENPAKETDKRYDEYVRMFGYSCWELDAVDPSVLRDLVRKEVLARRDENIWNESLQKEEDGKRKLQQLMEGSKRGD